MNAGAMFRCDGSGGPGVAPCKNPQVVTEMRAQPLGPRAGGSAFPHLIHPHLGLPKMIQRQVTMCALRIAKPSRRQPTRNRREVRDVFMVVPFVELRLAVRV